MRTVAVALLNVSIMVFGRRPRLAVEIQESYTRLMGSPLRTIGVHIRPLTQGSRLFIAPIFNKNASQHQILGYHESKYIFRTLPCEREPNTLPKDWVLENQRVCVSTVQMDTAGNAVHCGQALRWVLSEMPSRW